MASVLATLPEVTKKDLASLRRSDEYLRINDRLARQVLGNPSAELVDQASWGNAGAVAALLDVGVPATWLALRFALASRGPEKGLTARLLFDAGARIPPEILH